MVSKHHCAKNANEKHTHNLCFVIKWTWCIRVINGIFTRYNKQSLRATLVQRFLDSLSHSPSRLRMVCACLTLLHHSYSIDMRLCQCLVSASKEFEGNGSVSRFRKKLSILVKAPIQSDDTTCLDADTDVYFLNSALEQRIRFCAADIYLCVLCIPISNLFQNFFKYSKTMYIWDHLGNVIKVTIWNRTFQHLWLREQQYTSKQYDYEETRVKTNETLRINRILLLYVDLMFKYTHILICTSK